MRRKLENSISLLALVVCCAQAKLYAGQDDWVTTWGCAPQLVEPRNLPPAPLANSTLRQFVHVSMGGDHLRVHFSNTYGADPVTMNSVHVALGETRGSADNGNINVTTDTALTFQGSPSVTIPAGGAVDSDPFDFNLPAQANFAISVYFGNVSATSINGHPGSRTTSFLQSGNVVTAASMPDAARTQHWYFITGVESSADITGKAVVVLGDSITDGRGSTTDGNNRWPDDLAERFDTNAPAASIAVVNMGIGGNGIFGGLGPAAVRRFDRDVLNQAGVRWMIVFEGVNDIGGNKSGTIATNLITAYTEFINRAHVHHVLAFGATITPFGGSFYYTSSHEAARQTVNTWIRTNNLYDAVIDFDAAVRDPLNPTKLLSAYDSGDDLHLNPAGYRAMANGINLNLFIP